MLRGLDGEERWEYCETILRQLGRHINQKDPELNKLMDQLAGHPLAMRVVLQRLEKMSVASVSDALRNNLTELGLQESDEGRLFATLGFVEQGLPENLRPMLPLVGLHESYLVADHFEAMAQQVDPAWTRALVDQLMVALRAAGLLRDLGKALHEMHPLLTSYLRSHGPAPQSCQSAFVDIMARIANALAPKELHEQLMPFLLHGANFNQAQKLSENAEMEAWYFGALTQLLASYARKSRDFVESYRLYEQLGRHSVARGDSEHEASSYHNLGIIAQEQRDFETAREWYLKSLAFFEQQGNLHAGRSYHNLGIIAQEQRDFETAREWYLKSLAIEEQQGNLHGAAGSYHQLGDIAHRQQDFETARERYLKSLAIFERQGNLHGAASSYHQLGRIAQEQRDFETAREWTLKSLAIKEKQGNLHGAAGSYTIGDPRRSAGHFEESGSWLARSISAFLQANDNRGAEEGAQNFLLAFRRASAEDKQKMRVKWEEAGLGPFPQEADQS